MSNFDINVETDRRTNGKGDVYFAKQEVREMFHARFDGCLVL